MTVWMLYLGVVSLLFAVAARAAESALLLYGRPVRLVWAAALVGSLLPPVVFGLWLGDRTGDAVESVAYAGVAAFPSLAERAVEPALLDRLRLPAAFDRAVGLAWAGSAGMALVALGLWFGVLARAPRRWPRTRLDDEDVRIAPSAGPAVFGLLRPSIVVPRWLLECPPDVRRLALLHEREHVAARDPALLALGATLAALTPWNPVSWWLLFRLRAAVELDCDRRVLRRGAGVHAYGAMLVGIAGRTRSPRPALALVEPAELLERRIRTMIGGEATWRGARGLAWAAGCAVAVLAACSMDAPTAPAPLEDEPVAEVAPAATRDEVLERIARVVGELRAQLRETDREAGTATLEVLDPVREARVTAETRAVIRQLVEAQVERELPLKAADMLELRGKLERAARTEQEAVRLGRSGIVKLRPAGKDTIVAIELPLKSTNRIVLREKTVEREPGKPLMFIDGRPASKADVDALGPDRIDRIEVLKGAAAARMHGPDAKDGVVHITTKKR